jgi:hypothetical protein
MHASSPHDPDRLAEDLLNEVRRDRAAVKSRVPPWLRSAELMALPPALQEQVLLHARRRAMAAPSTIFAFLVWGGALIAMLFLTSPQRAAVVVSLGWIPALLAHTLHVRRRARQLARDLAAAAPSPH